MSVGELGSMRIYSLVIRRISPPPERTKPEKSAQKEDSPKRPEPVLDMELEIPSTPPPVEDVIASRRAKRQAILAKYSEQDASPISLPMSNSVEPAPELPVSVQLKESETTPTNGKIYMMFVIHA